MWCDFDFITNPFLVPINVTDCLRITYVFYINWVATAFSSESALPLLCPPQSQHFIHAMDYYSLTIMSLRWYSTNHYISQAALSIVCLCVFIPLSTLLTLMWALPRTPYFFKLKISLGVHGISYLLKANIWHYLLLSYLTHLFFITILYHYKSG